MKKFKILLATLTCLSLTGCVSSGITGREEYKNYGEKVDDTRIVSFIKNKFRTDPLIPSNLIHIAVDRGIVQLSGFVKTHREADLALMNVKNTPGVKDVINSLVILSSAEYSARRGAVEQYETAR
jgi:hyperosmotically inducible protein